MGYDKTTGYSETKAQNPSLCQLVDILDKEIDSVFANVVDLDNQLGPVLGQIKTLSAKSEGVKKDINLKSALVDRLEKTIEKVRDITQSIRSTRDRLEI
jgi:uncharacterized protein YoxC